MALFDNHHYQVVYTKDRMMDNFYPDPQGMLPAYIDNAWFFL